MFDLSSWTGADDVRVWINQPFNMMGKTVATNGHLMIFVDEDKQYTGNQFRESTKTTVAKIRSDISKVDFHTNLSDLKLSVPKNKPCTLCSGTGHCTWIECKECKGDGDLTFLNGFNEYWVECKSCDGDGGKDKPAENTWDRKCDTCCGQGRIFDKLDHVEILGITIQPSYFELLLTLGGGVKVGRTEDENMLYFSSRVGAGVVMRYTVKEVMQALSA